MADKEMIRAFLQRVATDAAFRDQLLNESMKTLTEAGFTVPPYGIPAAGITLPSNAEILANLDSLSTDIEGVHWHRLG